MAEVGSIVRRALETVRLMNTAALNSPSLNSLASQDTGAGRAAETIYDPAVVDALAIRARHESVLLALNSGTMAWFSTVLRRYTEVGDLSDDGRRKMPGMMRGADGTHLALTRRQAAKIDAAALEIAPETPCLQFQSRHADTHQLERRFPWQSHRNAILAAPIATRSRVSPAAVRRPCPLRRHCGQSICCFRGPNVEDASTSPFSAVSRWRIEQAFEPRPNTPLDWRLPRALTFGFRSRRQRRMQVSARVTVTPSNLDLVETLDGLIDLGFHSVGFAPMLSSPTRSGEMDQASLEIMLARMIDCGQRFEDHVIAGIRYPFLNMVTALRELHAGTHRPYPCGAGAGYLGVSADGDLYACHRFVDDSRACMGSLDEEIDSGRRTLGWRNAMCTARSHAGNAGRAICAEAVVITR